MQSKEEFEQLMGSMMGGKDAIFATLKLTPAEREAADDMIGNIQRYAKQHREAIAPVFWQEKKAALSSNVEIAALGAAFVELLTFMPTAPDETDSN
jgi:hypothetical protein